MNKKTKITLLIVAFVAINLLLRFLPSHIEMGDSTIDVIAFLEVGSMFACAIAIWLYIRKVAKDEEQLVATAPVFTGHVRVLSKTAVHSPVHRVSKGGSGTMYRSSCYIAFEFSNGSRKNFHIENVDQYNTILEGEEGILTYKEHRDRLWFVSFQPGSAK